jgi:phage terminase large subunit GpA-like protein
MDKVMLFLLLACRGFIEPIVDTAEDNRLSFCGEAASYYMCRGHDVDGKSCVPDEYWKGFYIYYSTCMDYQHSNELCWECMTNYDHMTECPPENSCDNVCALDANIIHQEVKKLNDTWYCKE